ncbi:hypothetical protein [Edaphovirga cremea]|uniref:hypothetical protein n=1 Tax=Edaphovirga cremea TaxID=2267246 RepID=UPI000DEFC4AE|nr:hypothetical protein [Edaphovirga cremea]
MKDYVLFFNDKTYMLVELAKLKRSKADKLADEGYARVDFKAQSREDAILKANELTGINTNSLKDFSGDVGFSTIIESLLR